MLATERKHPLAQCENCPLAQFGHAPSQFPTGSNSGVAIVSRSPADNDTITGRPFSGPSGKVLDYLLKQNGVDRSEVLVTNVVLCSPPEGKVPNAAIEACAPRLKEELGNFDTIISAGSESVNSLIGKGTINHYRGYRITRGSRTFVATNNPALVLRDDSVFPNLVRDFHRAFNPQPKPAFPNVKLIEDGKVARDFLSHYSTYKGLVSCDVESRGGLSKKAELVCIQFAFDGGASYVIGERGKVFEDRSFINDYLRPFLESTDRSFVWHNGIFDTKILRHTYGIDARVDEDTILLSWAVDERSGDDEGGYHSLDYLLMEELGWPHYTPSSVNSFKKTGKLVSDAELKKLKKEYPTGPKLDAAIAKATERNYIALYTYAGYDCAGTYQLFEKLAAKAKEEGTFDKPYKETLLASGDVIRSMEETGMPYNYHKAAEMLEKEVSPELLKIKLDMRHLTGKPLLNPASPQQMSAFYYDDYEILHDMRLRADKSRSADESARKEIIDGRFTFKGEYEFIEENGGIVQKTATGAAKTRKLLKLVAESHDRFQKLNKQAGTYLTGLIQRAELDEEWRIYTSLSRHSTSTGRLASSGPNLQNITRTKEGLPDIRDLFFAPDGTMLVQLDYSQAELRSIAALSQDPLLLGVYERDEDLHSLTAERFYGAGFTSEQRSNSKNMNFGVFYRQSADTFLEKHEIPVAEAQEYIDWVWATFTTVGTWERGIEKLVHNQKYGNYNYVQSPFGHRRRFYFINRENRNAVYREAINFYPQNIAAQLTLHACIDLHQKIDHTQAALCLTVHDSILAFVKEAYIEEYTKLAEACMVTRPKELLGWSLPFKVDIGVGKTWATAK